MTNSKGHPLTFGFRSNTKVLKYKSKRDTNKMVDACNEAKIDAYKAFWDSFNADLYKEIVAVKFNSLNR